MILFLTSSPSGPLDKPNYDRKLDHRNFFLFNLNHIDSNSNKRLIYNSDDIYDVGSFKVYFVNSSIDDLREVFDILDLNITSYTINGKKYYARNIDILENEFLKNKTKDEILYYMEHGIKVDKINVVCTINEIMKLENMVDIY